VCASAVVMLDTPCSEVVWRVLATQSIRQFPLHFPFRASPSAITFQLDSTKGDHVQAFSVRYGLTRGNLLTKWRSFFSNIKVSLTTLLLVTFSFCSANTSLSLLKCCVIEIYAMSYIYIPFMLGTECMEQSPCKVKRPSASQETPRTLWNPGGPR